MKLNLNLNSILAPLKALPGQVKARLPHVSLDRTLLIPVTLLLLFTLGIIGLAIGLILPALDSRVLLAKQLEQERTLLLRARQMREEPPDSLRKRIANAQSTVDNAALMFLGVNQVNTIVSAIYENAKVSGVALTDLSIKTGKQGAADLSGSKATVTPTPANAKPTVQRIAAASPTSGGAAKGTPAAAGTGTPNTPKTATPPPVANATTAPAASLAPSLYQLTNLHLQAQGTSDRLVNFLARLNETGAPGVVIAALNITGKDDLATLSLDLALYSSALVGQQDQTAQGAAVVTPRALPTPTNPADAYPVVVSNAVAPAQAVATPTAQRLLVYPVQTGDSLVIVAKRFHASAQAIVNANALTDLELHPGQKLLIPMP